MARARDDADRYRRLDQPAGSSSPGRTGPPLHPEYATRRFERLAHKAGLPPIRLHDLRHVAATLMLAAGYDLKLVQELLGHSTITVTSDTYTTVLPDVARAAAEGVAELLRTSWPPASVPNAGSRATTALPPDRLKRWSERHRSASSQVTGGAACRDRTDDLPLTRRPLC